MKSPAARLMRPLLLAAIALVVLAAPAARADREVTGDFSGKTKCENGLKKAGFKDSLTKNITWYSLNEIAHAEQKLGWPDSENQMSFDDREKQKTQMRHVIKVLHDLNCDTQDNPAQSGTGLQEGTKDSTTNATKNAVTPNSYVEPSHQGQQ